MKLNSCYKFIAGLLMLLSLAAQAQNPYCPTVTATGSPRVSCFGAADGTASVTVTGGSGNFRYNWNTGATTTTINFLPAGIYYINVTDMGTGCNVFDLVVIGEPDPLEANFNITHVNCNGQATGQILTTVSGGTPPFTYTWSSGPTTANLTNIQAGNYTLTVRDSRNCTVVRNATVLQPASPVQATIAATDVSCAGNIDGSVDLTVWGGTPPYVYDWNNGQFATQDLENVPAGVYTVVVTDEKGCTGTLTATVQQPSPINVTDSKTDVNCFGGSDGTISITANGGLPPYTYKWANSQFTLSYTTANTSGLSAETYRVTVTDARSCTATRTVVVNQPLQPLTVDVQKSDVLCFGGSDGTITLVPSGGTAPYTFLWSNGSVSDTRTGLAIGNYVFTVTDNNGCTESDTIVIAQPAAPLSNSFTVKNVSCFLGTDGMVTSQPAGGTPPYFFDWNSGTFSTQTISNVTAGIYNLLLTDFNGCVFNDAATVAQPTQLVFTNNVTHVDCYGNATGNVDLTVSGGTPPYTYNWDNSTYILNYTLQDIVNVPADLYYYTVTDAKNCVVFDSVEVEQPDSLHIVMTVQDVSCYGESDGSIEIVVTGGVLLYAYQWSNAQGIIPFTSQNIYNQPAQTYTVLVTDANLCEKENTAIINQPDAPLMVVISGTDVKCHGGNDGTSSLLVTGGTAPYFYSWSNGGNTQNQTQLTAGLYDVTVADMLGCDTVVSITIFQPAAPLQSVFDITHVRCFSESNGAADLTVTGGTPPYRYAWVNSDFVLSWTAQDLLNFPADTYTVTIIDTNNCLLVDTAIISEPPLLEIVLQGTDVKCFGENTGAIDLTITGGTLPYSVNWSNGSTSEDLANLFADDYSVMVNDANNCIAIDSILIAQPDRPLTAVSETVNARCFGGREGRLLIVVDGGTPPYNYVWSTGDSVRLVTDLFAGFYGVTVTDSNACVLLDSFEVTQPGRIEIIPVITDVSCYGFSDGKIEPEILGGTPPFRYHWANSDFQISIITIDLLDVPTDTYTIEVTDSNACFGTATFFITEPDTMLLTIDRAGIRCYNEFTGSIEITVTGGNPGYDYVWNNGSADEDLFNIEAGIYAVTITDSKGCVIEDTLDIYVPDPITLNVRVIPNSCLDLNDGAIIVQPKGGHGSWQYDWSNGSTSNPLSDALSGNYFLTVTDLLSCQKDTMVFLPVVPDACIEVPNSFTPNGDGINDQWQIRDIEMYPNAVVKVFNKWGRLVFESPRGYTRWWDGTFNGNPLPSDTYYYVLDLGSGRLPKSGPITIVR